MKRKRQVYYEYLDSKGGKVARYSYASYETYKKAYKKQAVKVATDRIKRDFAREKRRLVNERADILKYRKLTREESQYYKRRIANVTLNKENLKAINKTARGIARNEQVLRDKMLYKQDFLATYESMKKHLAQENIKGDPTQYIVRQQAYAKSADQASALLDAYRKEKRSAELWQKAATYLNEYGEVYEFTEEEQSQLIDPDDYIFYEFREPDEFDEMDIGEFNEYNIRTEEIELERFIDFEKVKEKYHELVDSGAYDSYGARAEIGRLYWGSK